MTWFQSSLLLNLIFLQIVSCFLLYCPLQCWCCQRERKPQNILSNYCSVSLLWSRKVLEKHQAAAVTSSSHNLRVIAALCSLPFVVFLLWSQMCPESVILLLAHRISETFEVKTMFKLSTRVLQIIMVMGKVSRTWLMQTCNLEFSLRPLAFICVFKCLITEFS